MNNKLNIFYSLYNNNITSMYHENKGLKEIIYSNGSDYFINDKFICSYVNE
jgi:hypothetical protein